jgi:hypothetical protein
MQLFSKSREAGFCISLKSQATSVRVLLRKLEPQHCGVSSEKPSLVRSLSDFDVHDVALFWSRKNGSTIFDFLPMPDDVSGRVCSVGIASIFYFITMQHTQT